MPDPTNWMVGLPDFLKLNPHLERRTPRSPHTFWGLLIAVPGARWGYENSYIRWGSAQWIRCSHGPLIELYAPQHKRWGLLCQPNFTSDNPDGRCRCGCVDRLAQRIDAVNENHAASRTNHEYLTVTIHPTAAWYGHGGRPLIVVHSNAVPANMPA